MFPGRNHPGRNRRPVLIISAFIVIVVVAVLVPALAGQRLRRAATF